MGCCEVVVVVAVVSCCCCGWLLGAEAQLPVSETGFLEAEAPTTQRALNATDCQCPPEACTPGTLWGDPGNASAIDRFGAPIQLLFDQHSRWLCAYSFPVVLPGGAEITGVTVKVLVLSTWETVGQVCQIRLMLPTRTSTPCDPQRGVSGCPPLMTQWSNCSCGGTSHLWGFSPPPTAAEVTHPGFTVCVSFANKNESTAPYLLVDWVGVSIHFQVPPAPTSTSGVAQLTTTTSALPESTTLEETVTSAQKTSSSVSPKYSTTTTMLGPDSSSSWASSSPSSWASSSSSSSWASSSSSSAGATALGGTSTSGSTARPSSFSSSSSSFSLLVASSSSPLSSRPPAPTSSAASSVSSSPTPVPPQQTSSVSDFLRANLLLLLVVVAVGALAVVCVALLVVGVVALTRRRRRKGRTDSGDCTTAAFKLAVLELAEPLPPPPPPAGTAEHYAKTPNFPAAKTSLESEYLPTPFLVEQQPEKAEQQYQATPEFATGDKVVYADLAAFTQ